MPQLIRFPVLVLLLASLLVVSCSDDSPNEPPPDTPQEDVSFDPAPGSAVVEGYVYRAQTPSPEDAGSDSFSGGDLIVVADPDDAPSGGTPAGGLSVSATTVDGESVFEGSTASDGRFRFEPEEGFLSLRFDGGTLEVDVSAFAGTTLSVGQPFPVSLEEARETALGRSQPTDLVLGTMQPLPAGSVVYPSIYVSEGSLVPASEALRVDEPSWLFYLDHDMTAAFGHAVTYLLISASTGEVETLSADWPPAINHRPVWTDETTFIRYVGIDPLDFDAENIPQDATFEASPEVLQLPEGIGLRHFVLTPDEWTRSTPNDWAPNPGSNSDTFVIAIQAGTEPHFGVNLRNVAAWFRLKGVPASQIAAINLSGMPLTLPGRSQYKSTFEQFDQIIRQRLEEEQRKSTLVVWFSGHSHAVQNKLIIHGSDGLKLGWEPSDLCLAQSRACKLRIFLDTCFADRFAEDLAPLLPEHNYRIAAACRIEEVSRYWALVLELKDRERVRRPGGLFSNAVLDVSDFSGNDFTGLFPSMDGEFLIGTPGLVRQEPQVRSNLQEPSWCNTDPVGICCLPDGTCVVVIRESACDGEFRDDVTSCDPNPCPQLGACCFGEGECAVLLPKDCQSVFGTYLGAGVTCGTGTTPCPGACCLPTGECQMLAADGCENVSGLFRGPSILCADAACPIPGACCGRDGSCGIVLNSEDCSGEYLGDGSNCEPNPCPQPGACCNLDGQCFLELERLCDGAFLGAGTTCEPNECPQPGACCFPEDGSCEILSSAQCSDGDGNYLGNGTPCQPENPCPQPPEGACCWGNSNENCVIRNAALCARELGGEYLGNGTTCTLSPCTNPTAGACCLTSGNCQFVSESTCDGDFQGVGVPCSPRLCDDTPVGACCIEEVCRTTTEGKCDGLYQGDGTICDPNPCATELGACCIGSTCELVQGFDECDGTWLGIGTICEPDPCLEAACCIGEQCTIEARFTCDGDFFEDETSCDPNPCLGFGACCAPFCAITTEAACDDAGGVFLGRSSNCDPNPCGDIGACCTEGGCFYVERPEDCSGDFQGSGSRCDSGECLEAACCSGQACLLTTAAECDGDFFEFKDTCDPNPCFGACCKDGAECFLARSSDCGGGYQGDGTLCEPDPCPRPGACCFSDGGCILLPEIECKQGIFQGEGTVCEPTNPCEFGACCIDGTCFLEVAQTCFGEWQGKGTTCDPDPCRTNTATIKRISAGVIHGRGSSDVCLVLAVEGVDPGAIVEINFSGPTNPGSETETLGADNTVHFDHEISLFGTYPYEVTRVTERAQDFELAGHTSGEIVVTSADVPCSR